MTLDAIPISLRNHPQFYECIIQLYVECKVFSISEVLCSDENSRDLLCLVEKKVYRSRSTKTWGKIAYTVSLVIRK